jgi:hypothetical protein
VRRASVVASVLVLLGCAGAVPVDDTDHEATLELGTGTWRFEPIEDGQEVPLIRGAQGGWHVWLSVRASGLESSTGRLVVELQPGDDSTPPEASSVGVQLDPPDAEGRRSYLGWAAILSNPSCAMGRPLRVHVSLTTGSGEQISAERYLVPGPGESPPPACTE